MFCMSWLRLVFVILFMTVGVGAADKKIVEIDIRDATDSFKGPMFRFLPDPKNGKYYYKNVEFEKKLTDILNNGYLKVHEETTICDYSGTNFIRTIGVVREFELVNFSNDDYYDNIPVLNYTKDCSFGELRKEKLEKGEYLYLRDGTEVCSYKDGKSCLLGHFKNETSGYNLTFSHFLFLENLIIEDEKFGRILPNDFNEDVLFNKVLSDYKATHPAKESGTSGSSNSSSGFGGFDSSNMCKCCCCCCK